MKSLHEAVHETATKALDHPTFVPLFRTDTVFDVFDENYSRIYSILHPLGYARLSFYDSGESSLTADGCALEVHPLVHLHYKKYGEEYIDLIEATLRLMGQTVNHSHAHPLYSNP
jgi:hypothetical protein